MNGHIWRTAMGLVAALAVVGSAASPVSANSQMGRASFGPRSAVGSPAHGFGGARTFGPRATFGFPRHGFVRERPIGPFAHERIFRFHRFGNRTRFGFPVHGVFLGARPFGPIARERTFRLHRFDNRNRFGFPIHRRFERFGRNGVFVSPFDGRFHRFHRFHRRFFMRHRHHPFLHRRHGVQTVGPAWRATSAAFRSREGRPRRARGGCRRWPAGSASSARIDPWDYRSGFTPAQDALQHHSSQCQSAAGP